MHRDYPVPPRRWHMRERVAGHDHDPHERVRAACGRSVPFAIALTWAPFSSRPPALRCRRCHAIYVNNELEGQRQARPGEGVHANDDHI